jgi:FGGY-family pentulose kinase
MAVARSDIKPEAIRGVGFDATCSLTITDKSGAPLSVDPESGFNEHERNIILWADHRAIAQANRINATKHKVLQYVGKTISPEMEIPKTLWLSENMPAEKFDQIGHIFDLPDYLTFRATGSLARSTCSVSCKCSFAPLGIEDSKGWDEDYFRTIGLGQLADEGFKRLGGIPGETGVYHFAGDPVGNGLNKKAAEDLGLIEGTPVGSAVIDAYAGAIATLGASSSREEAQEMASLPLKESLLHLGANRLAIICGTSSCHIAMAPEAIFVPGVWGPYKSVLLPDMWCAEGGQSSTGQLIDHILNKHPAIDDAKQMAKERDMNIYAFLNTFLEEKKQKHNCKYLEDLVTQLHIYPDFHGNRSPLADPTLRGVIVGNSLDASVDDLAVKYLATLQAISCQTRHIIESLNSCGYTIDTLCLSGGLCKNPIFVQLHADITGCKVILPKSIEGAVVIGAGFLGARAAGLSDNLWDVMIKLGQAGDVITPSEDPYIKTYNERRYKVFKLMLEDQRKYRRIMAGEE